MAYIASDAAHPDHGALAALLLAINEELGFHPREVKTVRGGFEAPDAVVGQLVEVPAPAVPAVTAPAVEEKTPPAWWSEPEPESDVRFGEDGKVYLTDEALLRELSAEATAALTEPDRETVRAWAKENGHQVADKGQLKKVVYDAYTAAQVE